MKKTVSGITGVEKAYYALLKNDDPNGTAEFEKPVYLQGIKEMGLKVTINTEKNYAENKVWEADSAFDSTELTLKVVDLTSEDEAVLLGHTLAAEGGLYSKSDDKAPDVAILLKCTKGNGKARYLILYKNTFSDSDESAKGKEGKTDFQEKSIVSTGASLKSNGLWKYKVDEEDGMTDEKFFSKVIIPTALTYVEVAYADYSTGDVTDISIDGVTFDKAGKKFLNVPSNATSFTFKLDTTTKTATKNDDSWTIA